MRELVFISSPYSHKDPEVMELNYELVSKFVLKLINSGVNATSPIAYGHPLVKLGKLPSSWEFWEEFCLSFLERSSKMIVYKIPGWENSIGMKAEIEFAEKNNIPIEYVEYVIRDSSKSNLNHDRIKTYIDWIVKYKNDKTGNQFKVSLLNNKWVSENSIENFEDLIFIKPVGLNKYGISR